MTQTITFASLNINSFCLPTTTNNNTIDPETADVALQLMGDHQVDVIAFQESFILPAEDFQQTFPPLFPHHYGSLFSTTANPALPPTQRRGQGQILLAHPRILSPQHEGWSMVKTMELYTPSLALLGATLGPYFIVNAYLRPSEPPTYDHLADLIHHHWPQQTPHLILMGDFNHPTDWAREGEAILTTSLRVRVVAPPPGTTHTHNRGNLLDYILVSNALQVSSPGCQWSPISDHAMIHISVKTPTQPRPPSTPGPPPVPQPPRIKTKQMRQLARQLRRPKRVPRAVIDSFDRESWRLHQRLTNHPLDLHGINVQLYHQASTDYKLQKPNHDRPQRAYMYFFRVRKASYQRQDAFRAVQTARTPESRARRLAKYQEKDKAFKAIRKAAINRAHRDHLAAARSTDPLPYWFLIRRHTQLRKPFTPNTALHPPTAGAYYTALYADPITKAALQNTRPPPSRDPALVVTPKEVARHLRSFKDAAPGPDGVPPLYLKLHSRAIKVPLATACTQALQEGLPDALKVGKVTLLPKTPRPSADPAKYRPITLLPAIVRLLLQILEERVRRHFDSDDGPDGTSIPIEQGGFVPDRNTYLQAFLLLFMRDQARHSNKDLFAVFLDIHKAFDKINHLELLSVLNDLGLPQHYIDAIHRLLLDFHVDVMGTTVPVDMGTFQGSPLSPLLCILFLTDLIQHVNGATDSIFRGITMPWRTRVLRRAIRLLLFADDVAIPAYTCPEIQAALELITAWAIRRKIVFAPDKSKAIRLNRTSSCTIPTQALPPLHLHGQRLDWVDVFRYLGIPIVSAPDYGCSLPSTVPYDEDCARRRLYGFRSLFGNTAGRQALSPELLRLGILQVVYAKALYPTALVDINYDHLDAQVYRCIRDLFHMPTNASSTYMRRELGIWPSRFYAHRRALRFLWRLCHSHWTHHAFHAWLRQTEIPAWFHQGWVHNGVMDRFTKLLATYGFTWKDLWRCSTWKGWTMRIAQKLEDAIAQYTTVAATRHDLPHIAVRYPSFQPALPAYLRVGGDLACAGMRFRYSRLRHLPGPPTNRGLCRFCRRGPENGHHLLRCTQLPPHLATAKCRLSTDIMIEAQNPNLVSFDAMYALHWAHQTTPLLQRVLAFMRNVINAYAAHPAPWEPPELAAYPVSRVRLPIPQDEP